MAGTNKLIQYGTWNLGTQNTYTDDELIALTTEEKKGILVGTIAYSNILNAIMRQMSLTTKVLGDVVADKSDADVNSGITDVVYASRMVTAIGNISKEVSVTIAAISISDTISGVTVNAQGLVTNLVALVANDIPTLAISKIDNLGDALNAKVPNTRTIAGLTLAANRTRDDILGISVETLGVYRRTGANTYEIDDNVYATTDVTIAGLDLSVNRSLDDIMGISEGVGHVKRTAANTYVADESVYALKSEVVLKDSRVVGEVVIWRGTQAAYDLFTIAPGDTTIYIIVG